MHNAGTKKVLSLRTQLMLRFIAVSLIPIIIVSAFSMICISYFGLQEKYATETADLNTLTNVMNTEFMYAREAGISTARDELVRMYLQRELDEKGFSVSDDMQYQMRAELFKMYNASKIHSIYVYGMSGSCYTSQPAVLLDSETINSYDWYQEGVSSGRNYFWGESIYINNAWLLPYVRKVMDAANRTLLGYVVVNLYEAVLNRAYLTHGNVYVLLENGDILSCGDRSRIGLNYFELMKITAEKADSGNEVGVFDNQGKTHTLVYRNTYENPSLAKCFFYNPSEIIYRMLFFTGIAAVFCVLVCIVLAADQARRFIQPLRKMRERVDNMQPGVPSKQMHPRTNDEIGMLMDSFNNLSGRLTSSLEEIQRINEMRRKAEYRAIELQINPHFLYNTLSLIIYLADAGKIDKVKEVSSALSTLFRISVNRGKELVRISEELSHLRCYMDILSIRHQGEFSYMIDVDPIIMEYYTIKIILQPLVENAIQHGIRDNMIVEGFIRITAYMKDERIIFEIADNGNISQSRIDEMNAILTDRDGNENYGIGMRNVHNRIRMFFHEDYGLHYYKHGECTVAHIEIPALEDVEI